MDCKEVRRDINLFIDGKLNDDETLDFVEHIETCPDCKEELTIRYLVTEGMQRVEEGGAFDLNRELDDMIQKAGARAQMVSNFRFGIGLASMISVFVVAMVLVKVFIL